MTARLRRRRVGLGPRLAARSPGRGPEATTERAEIMHQYSIVTCLICLHLLEFAGLTANVNWSTLNLRNSLKFYMF